MICGKCKLTDVDVPHVKSCYSVQPAVAASDFKPMALNTDVPDSKYALQNENGTWTLYDVRVGKTGRYKGFRFVDRIVGAPGDWVRYPQYKSARYDVLRKIAADPKQAAVDFGHQHGICGRCSSPLSDPESIAAGLGPVCEKAF